MIASAKKSAYLEMYSRPETSAGWHFLTGDQENIETATRALGFEFEYIAASGQFSHPTAVYIVSPEGRITNLFSGITYPRKELQVALLEASLGRVQFVVNRLSAFCYAYMPHTGIINSPFRWLLLFCGLILIVLAAATFVYKRRKNP